MKNFFLAGMFLFTVASASGQVFQVDSSGNVTSSASFISNGSSPGQLTLIQGSPLVMPSLTSFSLVAPASITTSYQSIVPSAGADGWWRGTFGSGAGGTVTASSGVLQTSGIVISPGGTGYTLPPACWVSASTGSGGTCAATTVAGGQVTAATIVTGGTGYPNTGTVLHFGSQVQMTFAELTGDATTSSASSPVSTVKVVGIQGVGVGGVEGTSGNSVQLTSATSTTNNHVVTYDGSGNVKDSGTLITILAQTGAGSDINSSNKVVGIQGHAVGGIEGTATNNVQLTAATSTTNNDVVTYDGSGNVGDSGTQLSTLEHVLFEKFSTTDTVNCSTTETDFTSTYTIPSSYLVANKLLRVTIGISATTSSSPPGTAFNLKIGGSSVYTAKQSAPAASITSIPGGVTFYIQGTAAAGSSVPVHVHPILPPALNIAGVPFNQSSVTQPVNLATNGTLTITPGLVCSAATAGNSVTVNQMIVEALN